VSADAAAVGYATYIAADIAANLRTTDSSLLQFHTRNFDGARDRLLRGDADEDGFMLVEKFYTQQPRARA
jgi:hypothetical protein